MSQDLVVRPQPVLQKRKFDETEIAILRSSFGKQLDPAEFKVFVQTASHLNLDPFSREIYCLKYGNHPMTLITSIGGYRTMSARSGRYLGLTEGTFLVRTDQGQKLTVKHSEFDPDEHVEIISATIGVRVEGYPEPVMATAVFKSNAKKAQGRLMENWATMPDVMILKCAEAAAHRRAALFPDGAAAVYVEGEVPEYYDVDAQPQQALPPATEKPVEPTAKPKPPKTKKETPPPTQGGLPIDDVWENTPVGKKLTQIERHYRDQMSDPDLGWLFCMNRILAHFNVETPEQITDVEALRKFCTVDLLKDLKEENFLPMDRRA